MKKTFIRPNPTLTPDSNKGTGGYWRKRGYVLQEYHFSDFDNGDKVLDIGCGSGGQLEEIINRGYKGIGVGISARDLLFCREKHLSVLQAQAEYLPFKDKSFNGIVCKVVLSYTDEIKVMDEISRILSPGGKLELCVHGFGYYVNYLFSGSLISYAILTIINTWIYMLTGRRWRDTVYQLRRRMKRYFQKAGLKIERLSPSKSFLGMSVFVYYRLKKI